MWERHRTSVWSGQGLRALVLNTQSDLSDSMDIVTIKSAQWRDHVRRDRGRLAASHNSLPGERNKGPQPICTDALNAACSKGCAPPPAPQEAPSQTELGGLGEPSNITMIMNSGYL